MSPVFAPRRRAEEFDSLVARSATGEDTQFAELLEVVSALRAVPAPEARPEFVSDLRAQLMLAAETQLVPADDRLTLPTRRPARERKLAVAVGGLAIVGATTSMAMAAQSALPGDLLYPLKRAIENAEAGISVSDGQRGSTLLATASGRLDEVTALARDGASDEAAIEDTLSTFTVQATEAAQLLLDDYEKTGDETSISELRDFTGSSMDTLAELEAVIPAGARDELLHAAGVLTQIDAEAARACPQCAGAGINEIPAILVTSQYAVDPDSGAVLGEQTSSPGEKAPGSGKKGDQQPQAPADNGPLTPGSVLNPGQGGGNGNGDGNGQQDEGPLSTLTEGLLGGDSQPTSGPQGGLPGGSEVGDVTDEVDDAVGDVTDPLTGD